MSRDNSTNEWCGINSTISAFVRAQIKTHPKSGPACTSCLSRPLDCHTRAHKIQGAFHLLRSPNNHHKELIPASAFELLWFPSQQWFSHWRTHHPPGSLHLNRQQSRPEVLTPVTGRAQLMLTLLVLEVTTQMYHQTLYQGLVIRQGTTFTSQRMGTNLF